MRGLNELNLKKMRPKRANGNVPSTSSNVSLDDKTAIRFMIKKTKRFDYSIKTKDAEGAEQNHIEDKEMNRVQGEEINNVSPSYSLYHLLHAEIIQKKTPENQENIPAKKSKSDFVFLVPKVYRCYYCQKVFFHTSTYRRHMIRQLQKLHWCSICKRAFVSIMWLRKHKLFCYRRQTICKTVM